MAKAIVKGLVKKNFKAKLIGYDCKNNNQETLQNLGLKYAANAKEVVLSSNFIVLARIIILYM